MKKAKLFISALFLLIGVTLSAQNVNIKGTVKDASTGDGLPFAAVQLKGTRVGIAADGYGEFSLNAVPSNGSLVFSAIGYKTKEVAIDGQTVFEVFLDLDTETLDETIVVAYGTSTRSSFTGSASTVKSESIEKRQASNLTNTLSGAVSGVQTMSSNGQPGTSSTIRIRGFGSLNAGMSPLYVVDGVPYDGDIAAINTQDVESMTVLKDAASAALYGARGANGVILITTKKGRSADAIVTFDGRYGVNSRAVTNYNVMTQTGTYMEQLYSAWKNAGLYNLGYNDYSAGKYANSQFPKVLGYSIYTVPDGQTLFGLNGKLNPNATLGYYDGTYYYLPDDWAANTFSSQPRQEYNLSVSGGNERLSYYMSAGYLADNGVIVGSGFDRLTFRATVDYQAKKWLKVGTNVGFTNYDSKYPGEQTSTSSSGNAFFIANFIAPVYPLYVRDLDENNNPYIVSVNGNKLYDWGDGSSTNSTRNWMSIANPLGDLTYAQENYKSDIFNGKAYVTLIPFKGLTITGTLASMIDNTRYFSLGSSLYGQSAAYGGTVYQEHDRSQSLTKQVLANYNKSFGLHTIDVTAVYEGYEYTSDYSYASGQNLYRDGVPYVNNSIDQKRGGGANNANYSTIGYIGRINYDYDGRYFVSGSYRRDGSSRFAPDKRFGNFWSASAAWVISKEQFLSASWIDLLKLKASFGQQGNDSIGNYYAYLDQYSMTGADGVFSDGTLSYKGNPDLTWETTNAFNVGVDFDFWRGRLSGSVEYFDRTANNLLYNKPVASSNGYSSIPVNVGSVKNNGVELELNAGLVHTNNFQWDLFGNITYVKNTIVALDPDLEGELVDGNSLFREGDSRYQMYIVKYAGVDPETGEALYWAKKTTENEDGTTTEEEYKTADWAAANTSNRQGTGNLAAPFYGGFGTALNFYGFDFSVQFAYQLGGRLYDNGYVRLMHNGGTSSAGQNWHMDILDAWTPENTTSNIPRVCASDKYTTSVSDRWLISSNYLSLNNVTFGYTLPSAWTNAIKIRSARIYVAGDNLWVFSARKGLDPRQGVTAATTATYTALRTISGGVKLTF